jgi:PadR family transcriptional regulator, regulatory protein PadR
MNRIRALSSPARALLAALLASGGRWSYGYELASLTGIKSGTLYPLLIRLEAQGHLEAEWQQPVASGRPPRHAYRLTAAGRRLARAEAAAPDRAGSLPAWRPGRAAS